LILLVIDLLNLQSRRRLSMLENFKIPRYRTSLRLALFFLLVNYWKLLSTHFLPQWLPIILRIACSLEYCPANLVLLLCFFGVGEVYLNGMVIFHEFATIDGALDDTLPVEGDLRGGAAELPPFQLGRWIEFDN
jgi:hypothetical protein